MYGMIHRGIQQMVIDRLGIEAWQDLERRQGFSPADLVSAMVYDDALTMQMLEAAADLLAIDVAGCLEAFGRHWIRFAERGSFGAILAFTGRDLPGFVANLDRMHQAVVAAMPEARVPSFAIISQERGSLLVEYRSTRSGLESFVKGLLEGLLDRFGLTGDVAAVEGGSNGTAFLMNYKEG